MRRVLTVVLFSALSLTACAQPAAPGATPAAKPGSNAAAPAAKGNATADQTVRSALAGLDPKFKPDYIGAAPFPGFREVLVGGQVLYVSDDGRYLMQSQPYDIQNRAPASSAGLLAYRKALLDKVPRGERIVFAAAKPKHTLTVFTDIECGYCRKMHQDIPELNKLGITVEYLAFPRMGPASQDFTDMISVWCAADRRQALTSAKQGQPVAPKNCTSPVAMQYNLGQQVGVSGTPAVFAADGTQLGGYVPPAQLLKALERQAN
ncbi:thioredoxin fold domain-containing protein [Paracidovorax citrulli]